MAGSQQQEHRPEEHEQYLQGAKKNHEKTQILLPAKSSLKRNGQITFLKASTHRISLKGLLKDVPGSWIQNKERDLGSSDEQTTWSTWENLNKGHIFKITTNSATVQTRQDPKH